MGTLLVVFKIKSKGIHIYFVWRTAIIRHTSLSCARDEQQTVQHRSFLYTDEMCKLGQIGKLAAPEKRP